MEEKEYSIRWLYIPFIFAIIWILLFLLTTAMLVKVKDCDKKDEEERSKDSLCIMLKDF